LAAISQKKDYVARNFHADDKHGAAPGRFEFLRGHQADVDSFSQTPAGLTEGHLTSEAALGLCWLVLACLACAALFRAPRSKNKLSGPESFSVPPASFATEYHAKMTFQALPWWNIWPLALFGRPAPEKTFLDLKRFFPPPPWQPNTIPK